MQMQGFVIVSNSDIGKMFGTNSKQLIDSKQNTI